jgi:hypothetical protein
MSGTNIVGAGRDESLVNPMVAEITLVGDVLVIIKRNGVVGAGINTGLAAGAQGVIHGNAGTGSPES